MVKLLPVFSQMRKLPTLTQIYPLEVVACYPAPQGQKAHETVVTFEVKPSEVAKALESFGLKPGKPAVGEEEALEDQHRAEHHHRRARPEEDGGEHRADQVAGGAAGDGEVEHLRREDERRGQADEGHTARRERAAHAPQGDAEAGRRERAGRHRRLAVQEPIGDVHRATPSQSRMSADRRPRMLREKVPRRQRPGLSRRRSLAAPERQRLR